MVRYALLDVFTHEAFAGNGLAVVADAEGLDSGLMQQVTRELNLSETTFVLPPTVPGATHRVRIFTPGSEVPFAGHPTVGTALYLADRDHRESEAVDFVLEEAIGLVRVAVRGRGAARTAELRVAQLPQRRPAPTSDVMAGVLGLRPDQVLDGVRAPSVWSCGLAFTYVAVADLAALAAVRPPASGWHLGVVPAPEPMVFIYTTATGDPSVHVRARMFAPEIGVVEDPATGSAVSALSGALVAIEEAAGPLADGDRRWTVHQGIEMGRKSVLHLTATVSGGAISDVRVAGQAVVIGEGTMFVG